MTLATEQWQQTSCHSQEAPSEEETGQASCQMIDSSINSSCRRGNEHTNRRKKKKLETITSDHVDTAAFIGQVKSMTEQKIKADAN